MQLFKTKVQLELDSASKNNISSLVFLLTHLLHAQKKHKKAVTLGYKIPELPISSWQQPYLSFASIHNLHHRLAFEWYSYAELDIKITHIRNKELYINHKSSIIYCENVVKQNSILGPKVSIIHNYFTDTPNSLSQADNFSSSKLKATKKDTNFNFLFFSFIFLATKHRQNQNTHKKNRWNSLIRTRKSWKICIPKDGLCKRDWVSEQIALQKCNNGVFFYICWRPFLVEN